MDPDGREVIYVVLRDIRSYAISRDRSNPINTYRDIGFLYNTDTGETATFSHMQTVANYPSTDADGNPVSSLFDDTIAPGDFELKLYTTTNVADGVAGVITNAKTMDGRTVDANGYTENGKSPGRGLEHSNTRTDGSGKDYNTPYSKQCFIMPGKDNKRFFDTLQKWGVKDGESIKGKLYNSIIHREEE